MDHAKNQKIKAFEFLTGNRLGVLSTISYKTQKPEGALVYYVVDEKSIYFITPRQSRKLANMNQDSNVAFTIFTEVDPLELQLEGTIESLDDPGKKSYITKIYLEKANQNPGTINWPPVLKVANDQGFIFVKINIEYYKFSDFTEKQGIMIEGTPTDWP